MNVNTVSTMALSMLKKRVNVPPPPNAPVVKNVDRRKTEYMKKKKELTQYAMLMAKSHEMDECEDNDCQICAVIICPKKDITHLYPDGCETCNCANYMI